MLTAGLRGPADVITGWVIALLALTAAILVAVGLVRAWLGRRRPQVVIDDVELDHGVPPEAASGLSPQLRERVRRELRRQRGDAIHAEMQTVEEDIAAGLVTVRSGAVRMTAVADLDRTTSDSMAALSAGLRAVAPTGGEGLAVALDLALPAQRGWSVLGVHPTRSRRSGGRPAHCNGPPTTQRASPPWASSCTSCWGQHPYGLRSSS